MNRTIIGALTMILGLGLAGCSDDTGETAADQAVADTAVDQGQTPDRGPDRGVDLGPDLGADANASGCSDKVVGKACTSGGSECGKDHTCLIISASKGYCSCACTEDDPSTTMTQEDTCPGTSRCAMYAPPPSSTKKGYCFKTVGGTKLNTSSWSAADDHKSPVVLANKLVASEAFTAVAIQHKLLVLGKYCDNGLAHKVDLVVSTAAKPDASPTATESFSMAKAATTMYPRTITNTLTTPLTVAKGGHVFVLVDLATDAVAGMRLCLMSDGSTKSMERFVSDGPTAPFTWTSITGVPPQVSLLGF